MTMPDDKSMYEYYADPDNRVPASPARRRASQPLTTHVPIRFSPEVIGEVKRLADDDHKSVSSWIRDAVEDEIARRRPRWPHSIGLLTPNMNRTDMNQTVVGPSDAAFSSASSTVLDTETLKVSL
jgi:hypothetical protein